MPINPGMDFNHSDINVTYTSIDTGTIYTWGYGEQLTEVLDAVRVFTDLADEIKLVIFMGAMTFLYFTKVFSFDQSGKPFITPDNILGKLTIQIIMLVAIWELAIAPNDQASFVIKDEVTGYMNTVNAGKDTGLPLLLGEMLTLSSQIEKGLLELIEKSYTTPNSVAYSAAGIGFSIAAPLETMRATPKNRYLQKTLNYWIDNCFVYDIAAGNINENNITLSYNIIDAIAPTVNYLTVRFDESNTSGAVSDCHTEYVYIKNELTTEATNYLNNILPIKLGFYDFKSSSVGSNFMAALSATQQILHNESITSQKWIENEMFKNMLDEGFRASATLTGGSVASTAWSAAIAKSSTLLNWRMTGQQAKENLPTVRAVGMLLLVALSTLISVIAALTVNPKLITMVAGGFITLMMWGPIASILNYLYYSRVEDFFNATHYGPLMYDQIASGQLSTYMSNIAWWYGAIPVISYTIISGAGRSAMYLTRDIGQGAGVRKGAGGSAAWGDFSYGNTNINNQKYNSRSANIERYRDKDGETSNRDTSGNTQRKSMSKTVENHPFDLSEQISSSGEKKAHIDGAGYSADYAQNSEGEIEKGGISANIANYSLASQTTNSAEHWDESSEVSKTLEHASFALSATAAEEFVQQDGTGEITTLDDRALTSIGVSGKTQEMVSSSIAYAQNKAAIVDYYNKRFSQEKDESKRSVAYSTDFGIAFSNPDDSYKYFVIPNARDAAAISKNPSLLGDYSKTPEQIKLMMFTGKNNRKFNPLAGKFDKWINYFDGKISFKEAIGTKFNWGHSNDEVANKGMDYKLSDKQIEALAFKKDFQRASSWYMNDHRDVALDYAKHAKKNKLFNDKVSAGQVDKFVDAADYAKSYKELDRLKAVEQDIGKKNLMGRVVEKYIEQDPVLSRAMKKQPDRAIASALEQISLSNDNKQHPEYAQKTEYALHTVLSEYDSSHPNSTANNVRTKVAKGYHTQKNTLSKIKEKKEDILKDAKNIPKVDVDTEAGDLRDAGVNQRHARLKTQERVMHANDRSQENNHLENAYHRQRQTVTNHQNDELDDQTGNWATGAAWAGMHLIVAGNALTATKTDLSDGKKIRGKVTPGKITGRTVKTNYGGGSPKNKKGGFTRLGTIGTILGLGAGGIIANRLGIDEKIFTDGANIVHDVEDIMDENTSPTGMIEGIGNLGNHMGSMIDNMGESPSSDSSDSLSQNQFQTPENLEEGIKNHNYQNYIETERVGDYHISPQQLVEAGFMTEESFNNAIVTNPKTHKWEWKKGIDSMSYMGNKENWNPTKASSLDAFLSSPSLQKQAYRKTMRNIDDALSEKGININTLSPQQKNAVRFSAYYSSPKQTADYIRKGGNETVFDEAYSGSPVNRSISSIASLYQEGSNIGQNITTPERIQEIERGMKQIDSPDQDIASRENFNLDSEIKRSLWEGISDTTEEDYIITIDRDVSNEESTVYPTRAHQNNTQEELESNPIPISEQTNAPTIDTVTSYMHEHVGDNYQFGGTEPNCTDCSGLVQGAFKEVGINLPRTAWGQAKSSMGQEVDYKNVKEGDVIYFGPPLTQKNPRAPVTHTGVVTGFSENGTPIMTHAKGKRYGVVEEPLSNYYKRRIYNIKRYTNDDKEGN